MMNAPTSSNVSHCVSSSSKHKQRDLEALHKLHTFSKIYKQTKRYHTHTILKEIRSVYVSEKIYESTLTRVLVCSDWSILTCHSPMSQHHTADENTNMSNNTNTTLWLAVRMSSDLKNDAGRLIKIHHLLNNRLEQLSVTYKCSSKDYLLKHDKHNQMIYTRYTYLLWFHNKIFYL